MKKLLYGIINSVIEIKFHLFRSMLSLTGIILGVMNLSAMFSILEGGKITTEYIINSIGEPDIIWINLDWNKIQNIQNLENFLLSWNDVKNIKAYSKTIKNIGVEINISEDVQYKKKFFRFDTIGVSPSSFQINKYQIEKGRQITEFDMEKARRICVLGNTAAKLLFENEEPIRKKVKIRNDLFTVVGVIKPFGKKLEDIGIQNYWEWKNKRVIIPTTVIEKRFNGSRREYGNWLTITVQSKNINMVNLSVKEIQNILTRNHNGKDVFSIEPMQKWKADNEEFLKIWQIVLSTVAGISLLVGGIGITNVMLASFAERMREIGIRKSVGANNFDIFLLFLVETITICVIGGIIGLILGYIVSTRTLNQMLIKTMNSPVNFSFKAGFFSFAFSLLVGLFSGTYPAIRAAKLSPVEALRYE